MNKIQITTRLFEPALEFDQTLSVSPRSRPTLAARRVDPCSYQPDLLFKNMAEGKVSLFSDFPSPLKTARQRASTNPAGLILDAFRNTDSGQRIRTLSGKKGVWKYLTPTQLADKWQRNSAVLNVTDLHFRGTGMESVIDPARLSRFNLYPPSRALTSWLEMMTLVVSSRGGRSDSHSDDSDGSNHCFAGKKLWLAWDTHQGITAGLQDLDRQKIDGNCAFDIDTFLSLDSACWFTVGAGQTLFMPGHLSHKVITLEPYLGVGSFYLAYANFFRTLSRWLSHTPNWEKLEARGFRNGVYPELIRTAICKLGQLYRTRRATRNLWGLNYLEYSIEAWNRSFSNPEKLRLLDMDGIEKLIPGRV